MAGIELEGDNDDAANLVNELLAEPPGAKYLGFFSSRSLKTREKYISFAQFLYFLREVCLLFNFWMIKFTIMSKENHNWAKITEQN